MEYRKGTNHGVPDALSRNPVKDPEKEGEVGIAFGKISEITKCLGIKDINLEMIKEECRADEKYQAIHQAVLTVFEDFKSKYGTWTKTR